MLLLWVCDKYWIDMKSFQSVFKFRDILYKPHEISLFYLPYVRVFFVKTLSQTNEKVKWILQQIATSLNKVKSITWIESKDHACIIDQGWCQCGGCSRASAASEDDGRCPLMELWWNMSFENPNGFVQEQEKDEILEVQQNLTITKLEFEFAMISNP